MKKILLIVLVLSTFIGFAQQKELTLNDAVLTKTAGLDLVQI